MTDQAFITISTIIIFIAIAGWVCSLLFIRATKNRAYVRTGYGGEKLILNSGAIALPVLHKVIPVSLSTKRIEVWQCDEQSIITKDRIRANVKIDFYLNVNPDETSISLAAQSLGTRNLNITALKTLLEGKLVAAMRTVAAEFTISELQESGYEYTEKVKQLVLEHVMKNGLNLETVSLTSIDQTDIKFFNADNVFDAEGLTKLTRLIQEEKKACNEIEQQTTLEIKRKHMLCERLIQEMEKEKSERKLAQARNMEALENEQKMEKIKIKANQRLEEEQAKIRVAQEIALLEQAKTCTLAEKSKEQSKAEAGAKLAMADVVNAEEQVTTARELAKAERQKQIGLIDASMQAEREAMSSTSYAAAKKKAAHDLAKASRVQAESKAEAFGIISQSNNEAEITKRETLLAFYDTHSSGIKSLIETFSLLSKEHIPQDLSSEILAHTLKISEQSGIVTNQTLVKEPRQSNKRNSSTLTPQDGCEELKIDDRIAEHKSSKFRTIINDAQKTVLQEAISTLNEMSGDPKYSNVSDAGNELNYQ